MFRIALWVLFVAGLAASVALGGSPERAALVLVAALWVTAMLSQRSLIDWLYPSDGKKSPDDLRK